MAEGLDIFIAFLFSCCIIRRTYSRPWRVIMSLLLAIAGVGLFWLVSWTSSVSPLPYPRPLRLPVLPPLCPVPFGHRLSPIDTIFVGDVCWDAHVGAPLSTEDDPGGILPSSRGNFTGIIYLALSRVAYVWRGMLSKFCQVKRSHAERVRLAHKVRVSSPEKRNGLEAHSVACGDPFCCTSCRLWD